MIIDKPQGKIKYQEQTEAPHEDSGATLMDDTSATMESSSATMGGAFTINPNLKARVTVVKPKGK